ncbi:hypothetical protein CRG98_025027 [Punica granatum]|uniref:Uncharacterized protein n=1 Tax=Punica granatum TaxID=22663 RepID=A0A2I0JES9_PUNGR|nr:hypothetical protein CRG98_025027 [Punica granatum]
MEAIRKGGQEAQRSGRQATAVQGYVYFPLDSELVVLISQLQTVDLCEKSIHDGYSKASHVPLVSPTMDSAV